MKQFSEHRPINNKNSSNHRTKWSACTREKSAPHFLCCLHISVSIHHVFLGRIYIKQFSRIIYQPATPPSPPSRISRSRTSRRDAARTRRAESRGGCFYWSRERAFSPSRRRRRVSRDSSCRRGEFESRYRGGLAPSMAAFILKTDSRCGGRGVPVEKGRVWFDERSLPLLTGGAGTPGRGLWKFYAHFFF